MIRIAVLVVVVVVILLRRHASDKFREAIPWSRAWRFFLNCLSLKYVVSDHFRLRKQNTEATVPLDVVPERRNERFPPGFRPVGRFCELRFRYLSSPTAREGEISRPPAPYETDPIHPLSPTHTDIYISRYIEQPSRYFSPCTVEPRLSGPRLSGLFDYPDFSSGPVFFMNINKLWSQKLSEVKKCLKSRKVCSKQRIYRFAFNRFSARRQRVFWCIQLNFDWFSIVIKNVLSLFLLFTLLSH